MFNLLVVGITVVLFRFSEAADDIPPYVKQCNEGDPALVECLRGAVHHLRPYLARGIPEIKLPSVEPFFMEELALSLTSGPNGYKVSLKDIDIYGASNFTVSRMKLSEKGKPFEAFIHIPLLRINSRYQSSGVLIILPASGNGTFVGQLERLRAFIKGRVSINERDGVKYLNVDTLHVDLHVRNVRLAVKNVYRNNAILTQAINLFLKENGMEVFKLMLPQLQKKLSGLFMGIANQLLSNVPLEWFYVPIEKQTASPASLLV